MIKPIITYDNIILQKVCKTVESEDAKIIELIENMKDTMQIANGIGLAAPQINVDKKVFVIDATHRQSGLQVTKTFINPTILEEYGDTATIVEGCLSIPKLYLPVARPSKVAIEYYDENWNKQTDIFDDMIARVIQHEYDHLFGKLFISHVEKQYLDSVFVQIQLKDIIEKKIKVQYPIA